MSQMPQAPAQEMCCTGSRESSLGRVNRQGLETAVSLEITGEKIKKKTNNQNLAGIGIHVVAVNKYTLIKGNTNGRSPLKQSKRNPTYICQ